MALARFFRFVLVFVALVGVISVESSTPNQSANIVYTRYVRRKPTRYSRDKYYKEVVEVFRTKHRPPPFAFLNDEDLTRFVRCDYDPSLPGCEDAGIVATVKPISTSTTTTLRPSTRTPTTTTSSWFRPTTTTRLQSPTTTTTSTTTTVRPWFIIPTARPTTTTTSTTTTSTTTTVRPWFTIPTARPTTTTTSTTTTTTTTPQPTTTEELPLLPDIDDEEEEEGSGEVYDDEDAEDLDNPNGEETDGNEEENEISGQDENYPTDDATVNHINTDDYEPLVETDVVQIEPQKQEMSTTAKPLSLFPWG